MKITCPQCQTVLTLAEDLEGKTVRCPKCRGVSAAARPDVVEKAEPALVQHKQGAGGDEPTPQSRFASLGTSRGYRLYVRVIKIGACVGFGLVVFALIWTGEWRELYHSVFGGRPPEPEAPRSPHVSIVLSNGRVETDKGAQCPFSVDYRIVQGEPSKISNLLLRVKPRKGKIINIPVFVYQPQGTLQGDLIFIMPNDQAIPSPFEAWLEISRGPNDPQRVRVSDTIPLGN